MLGIVISRADRASVNIGEQLLALADWTVETDERRPDADGGGDVYRLEDVELREFETRHLELEAVDAVFDDPDLLVFASKHAGETGKLLTAHHTGNFGPAEYGGEDGSFARAAPNAHAAVVKALARHAPGDYDAGMECTHHGPTDIDTPSMFVEVGSAEPQWDDPDPARAVAKAILELRGVAADAPWENGARRHLVGFGGGHYVPRFERVVRETDWSIGHIGADWALEAMGEPDPDVLRAAFEASGAAYALLDDDRPELASTIESLGYRVVGETFARETTGVPLSTVEGVEDALGRIDEGIRLGDPAADHEGPLAVLDLPADLLEEVQGIDPDRARAAVRRRAVGFETVEGGTKLGGRVALSTKGARSSIVDEFAEILATKYESVERTDDAVVARERAFDPEKAATLGVPEGPAFGKLSAGQPVEVDGRTIDPDVVHVDREHRFPL
ncbi:D-aminoacyl-tRNA deacylase [Halapricum desulfuricans]|uniref:D-aminoacyl-tRNA deacylase n=1 Tax=Halapricum desulfuricans TaxID=2841257 RepID=A0A897N5L9_9EURY|nr:D-aminoacyl-tRNA deacylase [Halapricum desulfuricans]QSG08112.1 D-aminoacyl-tRNA deacylase, involved in ethanol tolerance [Halapricum desulfuricans]